MKGGNRNLFRLTRFVLLKIPFFFRILARFRKPNNRVLIIKTDAIGDYVLFRNYIEIITQSKEFKDRNFTLMGNRLWRDVAVEYDSKFVNDFLFIEPEGLYHSPLKTWMLGWRLFKNNYGTVLQPSYTRLLINDGLAALTAAKKIIGFSGDNEGIAARYKIKTDKFYSKLIPLPPGINFEFYRSAYFFQSILGRPILLNSPALGAFSKKPKQIVVFAGAGVSKRSWEKEKFLELIKLIRQYDPSYSICLAGGSNEIKTGEFLKEHFPQQSVYNLTGKTSLIELIELIGNAGLVVSNETSAIHIAAATKTAAVCILGGGHFGRFAPYPDDISGKPLCIYEKMECYNCNWNCKFETPAAAPFPCILNISVETVWKELYRELTLR